uniref:Uncharacterized protein n=1 Tax=Ditylenchus dipsaci TaxID=166011 RepID=A0A915D8B5_9BILA
MGVYLFLCCFFKLCASQDCFDQQYTNHIADLRTLHVIQRIAVVAPLGAFYVQTAEDESALYNTQANQPLVRRQNGETLVIYSSISSANLEWQNVNLLTSAVKIVSVFESDAQEEISPVIVITACPYRFQPIYLDAQPFVVDTHQARLVSMYENELVVNFRTFQNGIFFFSMADQGDMLVAQLSNGRAETMFDFGSLSRSSISGGKALNDGEWHELRWNHQFDSVQLFVDGVLVNSTTPSGLYRKLDFNYQNSIEQRQPAGLCSDGDSSGMPYASPQTLTIKSGSVQLAYSFLPFTLEFRLLPKAASLLSILNGLNQTLLEILVDDTMSLVLEAENKQIRQTSMPMINVADGAWHSFSIKLRGGRLDVDVDGVTVLWLEGSLVRKIGLKMTSFRLAAVGCYRSTTVDLKSALVVSGEILKDKCSFVEKCLPNPCENGGQCIQSELDSFRCSCQNIILALSVIHCVWFYTLKCLPSIFIVALLPRSCEDHRLRRRPRTRSSPLSGHFEGENVTIDLDGGGPLHPFEVVCLAATPPTTSISPSPSTSDQEDLEKDEIGLEVTLLLHDLPSEGIQVAGLTEPGAVKKVLEYSYNPATAKGVHGVELDRFVEGFEACRQYMRFECKGGTKLMTYGSERRPSTWYATRNEQHGLQWADAPPYSRMCSCGVNATCENNR